MINWTYAELAAVMVCYITLGALIGVSVLAIVQSQKKKKKLNKLLKELGELNSEAYAKKPNLLGEVINFLGSMMRYGITSNELKKHLDHRVFGPGEYISLHFNSPDGALFWAKEQIKQSGSEILSQISSLKNGLLVDLPEHVADFERMLGWISGDYPYEKQYSNFVLAGNYIDEDRYNRLLRQKFAESANYHFELLKKKTHNFAEFNAVKERFMSDINKSSLKEAEIDESEMSTLFVSQVNAESAAMADVK